MTIAARSRPTCAPSQAMGEALAGSGKPLVITSGTLMLALAAPGRDGTEATRERGPRVDAENAVIALADRGVRSSVIRLPPTVHSSLDHHGFIPTSDRHRPREGRGRLRRRRGQPVARRCTRWTRRTCTGWPWNQLRLARGCTAVGDEGVPFREIAEAIGRHLGVPAVSIAPEEAGAHFGFLGPLVSHGQPGLQRADPGAAGLEADAPRPPRGPGRGPLLQIAGSRTVPPRSPQPDGDRGGLL